MSVLGVTAASSVTTQLLQATNSVFPSTDNASYIGGLSENKTDLSVGGELTSDVSTDIYQFAFEKGSSMKLNFTNSTATTNLRVQILDVTGKVVADSDGDLSQVEAYNELTSSGGLSASTGTYYVEVSYASGASQDAQNYDFQLYSGSTYSTSIVSTALIASYDPSLFESALSSVSASSNAVAYTKTSTLPTQGSSSTALDIGSLAENETSLYASGTLTSGNRYNYYSFDFSQGSTMKLALSNTTNALIATTLRAQLVNSKGQVVADSDGTEAQQDAYKELTSGEGLSADNGQYTLIVSPLPGAAFSINQTYDLQLFSGSSYSTEYETTAVLPSSGSVDSAGSNVDVYASSSAELYTHNTYNTIGEKAASAVNIGWITADQSALKVTSQLTSADSADYYGFTLQQGDNLKFSYSDDSTSESTSSQVRIQLLDVSGTHVIADSEGTPAQQEAYKELTSSSGLSSKPGNYVVKVTYATGADQTKSPTYNLSIYSGTQYQNLYETTASAQTLQNAILSGNTAVVSYSASSAVASYLNDLSQGTTTDVMSALETKI